MNAETLQPIHPLDRPQGVQGSVAQGQAQPPHPLAEQPPHPLSADEKPKSLVPDEADVDAWIEINGVKFPKLNEEEAQENADNSRAWFYSEGEKGEEIREQYPLFCEPKDLTPLGVGVVFYFRCLESILLMLVVATFIFGLPGIIMNGANTSGSSYTSYARLSIGAQGVLDSAYVFGQFMLVMWIGSFCWRSYKALQKESDEMEKQLISTADYSVKLEGLPVDCLSADEVEAFCSKWGRVASVSVVANSNDIVGLRKRIAKLAEDIENLEWSYKKNMVTQKSLADKLSGMLIRRNLTKLKKEKGRLEGKFYKKTREVLGPNGLKCCGVAFVVFDRARDADKMLDEYESASTPAWVKNSSFLVKAFLTKLFTPAPRRDHMFRGQYLIRVRRAPEPNDINWPDLAADSKEKRELQIKSAIYMLLAGTISFLMLLGLFKAQINANDDPKVASNGSLQAFKNQLISVAIRLITITSTWVIVNLVNQEKHHTHSGRMASLLLKTFFVEILNSAISPFFSFIAFEHRASQWYASSGFIMQLMANMISDATLGNFLVVADIGGRVQRWMAKRSAVTQSQLNAAYAPTEFDLVERYVSLTSTVFMAVVFAVPLPLGLLTTALSFGAHYVIDRYFLLRLCRPPTKTEGVRLAKSVYKYIAVAVVVQIYLCAMFYWVRPATTTTPSDTSQALSLYGWFVFGMTFGGGFFLFQYQMVIRRLIGVCQMFSSFGWKEQVDGDVATTVNFSSVDDVLDPYIPPLARLGSGKYGDLADMDENDLQQLSEINYVTFANYEALDEEEAAAEDAARDAEYSRKPKAGGGLGGLMGGMMGAGAGAGLAGNMIQSIMANNMAMARGANVSMTTMGGGYNYPQTVVMSNNVSYVSPQPIMYVSGGNRNMGNTVIIEQGSQPVMYVTGNGGQLIEFEEEDDEYEDEPLQGAPATYVVQQQPSVVNTAPQYYSPPAQPTHPGLQPAHPATQPAAYVPPQQPGVQPAHPGAQPAHPNASASGQPSYSSAQQSVAAPYYATGVQPPHPSQY